MSHARIILKAEAKGRNWGELLGRDWRDDWQAMLGSGVHKDAVTGIVEKHIKDPALVKRLADAWDTAVALPRRAMSQHNTTARFYALAHRTALRSCEGVFFRTQQRAHDSLWGWS